MALTPIDEIHAAQIAAGTIGRTKGHEFEAKLSADLNQLAAIPDVEPVKGEQRHLKVGHPDRELVRYILRSKGLKGVKNIRAAWLGGLATFKKGDVVKSKSGIVVKRSKSDILLEISHSGGVDNIGVSVKTCHNKTPTNDQLYCTTAQAFANLLRNNKIPVSDAAERALRMFCGDPGFRPCDDASTPKDRVCSNERWFYDELPQTERNEFQSIFSKYQREISTILLQKAYPEDDPHAPEFLLHQTVAFSDIAKCECAIFRMDELVDQSCKRSGFSTASYTVKKGRFKSSVPHLAPRFGFIQFQRLGNKQNATQLQFNLEAGYFYKLSE
ncbi:hypothetical protein Pan44_23200 [Caulifigura coniformis]|uniref:Uncharacterized protein n=1 Tax=Caulifigura coniformis TaxID=2527983 RepID=A0A517SDT7_9PLAN|nr:hypothetical protein [Caulifigura coniformis]QDT54292.1 hypothetical protein Pan44_23200 [Caulifigura coniformis]